MKQVSKTPPRPDDPVDLVADKGYFSRDVLKELDGGPWRSRIAEPKRQGLNVWNGDHEARRGRVQQSDSPLVHWSANVWGGSERRLSSAVSNTRWIAAAACAGSGCAAGGTFRNATCSMWPDSTSACSCGPKSAAAPHGAGPRPGLSPFGPRRCQRRSAWAWCCASKINPGTSCRSPLFIAATETTSLFTTGCYAVTTSVPNAFSPKAFRSFMSLS